MRKGYQILEAERLDSLLKTFNYYDFIISVLYWLVQQLEFELQDELVGVKIEVIKVEYVSIYPALGIHYENRPRLRDLAPLVEATIDRLLEEKSVIELIAFITSRNDWDEIT